MNAESTTTHPLTDAPKRSIGERLKLIRIKRGLTQTQLAIQASTTATHIMDMENGYDSFEGRLTEIAEALNCNPLWLETGLGTAALAKPASTPIQPGQKATARGAGESESSTERPSNLSKIVVDLGHELEQITETARTRITSLLIQLIEHPEKRHLIAEKAQQAALRRAPSLNQP